MAEMAEVSFPYQPVGLGPAFSLFTKKEDVKHMRQHRYDNR